MNGHTLAAAVRRLRQAVAGAAGDDAALLNRFVTTNDPAAFAALVGRYGPLVLGVCRRVLGDAHAAEDVFQATFFVLARKAATVRRADAVGSWLYGVAYRLSRKAQANRRRQPPGDLREARADVNHPAADAAGSPPEAAAWADLLAVLDDELHRLPDRLRAPLVLCYLEDRTRDEAAAALGWSLATLKRRLERGRAILRQRLEARGVSGGLLAAAVVRPTVPADVPAATAAAAVAAVLQPAVGARAALAVVLAGIMASGVALAPRVPQMPATTVSLGALTQPRSPQPARDQFGDPLPAGAIVRLGTLTFCHGESVEQILTSADGRSILTRGARAVRVWDAGSGREDGAIFAPVGQYFAAGSLLPGGDQLALSWYDGSVHVWDWRTRREVRSFTPNLGPGRTTDFARCRSVHAPDGRTAVLLAQDGSTCLVDLIAGKVTAQLAAGPGPARAAAFAADGRTLATATGGTVHVWDTATGNQRWQFSSPIDALTVLAASPDGRWLALAGSATFERPAGGGAGTIRPAEKTVHVWDLAARQEVYRLTAVARGASTTSLEFAPDGRSLVTATHGDDGQVSCQWDMATGAKVRTLLGPETGPPAHPLTGYVALALSQDGRTLHAAETVVRSWDWQTGRPSSAPAGSAGSVSALAFLPDGRSVVAGGAGVAVWDAATGRQLRQMDGPPGRVDAVVPAPDGRTVAVASRAGATWTLAVCDTATGRRIREVRRPAARPVVRPVLSSDGRTLAVPSPDGSTVHLWDYATLTERSTVRLNPTPLLRLAFTPDGRTLHGTRRSVDGDWNVFSIDTTTGSVTEGGNLGTKSLGGVLAYSPDGRFLAAASILRGSPGQGERSVIRLHDAATGKAVREFTGAKTFPSALAVSADGKWLAAGGSALGEPVVIWDATTGERAREFLGHRGRVTTLTFSPDGTRLASGSEDTTVLVWDVSK